MQWISCLSCYQILGVVCHTLGNQLISLTEAFLWSLTTWSLMTHTVFDVLLLFCMITSLSGRMLPHAPTVLLHQKFLHQRLCKYENVSARDCGSKCIHGCSPDLCEEGIFLCFLFITYFCRRLFVNTVLICMYFIVAAWWLESLIYTTLHIVVLCD